MKLSVVVPVYNVQNYLSQCLDSLLNQDFKDFELILVNDGSSDNSQLICENYQKTSNKIILINKSNGGLSDARNVGIDHALGEYITFVDSDDYILSSNYFSTIVEYLDSHTVDLVAMPFVYSFDNVTSLNSKFLVHTDLSELDVNSAYELLIKNGSFLVSASTKVLRKSFLLDNNLYFEKGLLAEDNEWYFRVLRTCNKLGSIDQPFYAYRQNREGSITSNISIKSIKAMQYIINKSIIYYDQNEDSNLKYFELSFCAYLWCICVGHFNNVKDKIVKQELQKIAKILKYDKYPRVKFVKLLYRLAGFRITSVVLNKYLISRDHRNQKNKDVKC